MSGLIYKLEWQNKDVVAIVEQADITQHLQKVLTLLILNEIRVLQSG